MARAPVYVKDRISLLFRLCSDFKNSGLELLNRGEKRVDDAEPGVERMLGIVEEPCGLGPRLGMWV